MNRDEDLSTWEGSTIIRDFWMYAPDDKGENHWPTAAHVAWGPDGLYVAAECQDPRPEHVRGARHRRDDYIGDLDFFGLDLDASGKGLSAIRLLVTPSGGQHDAIVTDAAGENYSYDCLWDSVGLRTSRGYLVKLRIPYSSLRRAPGEWRLRMFRIIPRERRYTIAWPRLTKDINCDICQLAKVSGAPVEATGSPFLLIPSATVSRSVGLGADRRSTAENQRQLGLDLRYASTAVTFEGTYHPDFGTADADVDPLQINSRFRVFYPERRPFFLEGMELLGVQGAQRQFSSRSILNPVYGLKVSGQSAWASWTALSTKDLDGGRFLGTQGATGMDELATRDFAATARFRLDGNGSGLSILGTSKRTIGPPDHTGGESAGIYLDQYLGSEFRFIASALTARSNLAQEDNGHLVERGTASSGRLEWTTRNWNAFLQDQATSPDLKLLSGFADLQGYRRLTMGAGWQNTWNQGRFSKASLSLRYRALTWWNGDPLDRAVGVDASVETVGRWSLSLAWDAAGRTWAEDHARSAAARSLEVTLRWKRHSWGQMWADGVQSRTIDIGSGTPARFRFLSFGSGGSAGSVTYNFSAQTSMLDRETGGMRIVRARSLVGTGHWQLPQGLYLRSQAFAVIYDGMKAESRDKFIKVFAGWQLNAFTQAYLGWSGQRHQDPAAGQPGEQMVERGFFLKVAYAAQF